MLRIDGRVLVGAVLGLFLIGAALGFFVGGGFDIPGPTEGDAGTTTVVPTDGGTQMPDARSPTTTAETATQRRATTATRTAASTSTTVPTPTVTATSATPGTQTRILIRRFEEAEIRTHLERLLNDWRERKNLEPYRTRGNVVAELRFMANNHSVEMADAGVVAHTIDGRSSYDRYRKYKLDQTCRFKRNKENWIVTPRDEQLELVGKTYAGRTYVDNDTRKFSGDERAVAQAIFDDWLSRAPFRYRLTYDNTTHIGIGIETTRKNEVYATANLCGVGPANESRKLP